ncbi:helix-turn-helix domain-containing protein [Pelosinus sp. sgz500959]|uniref:helix-turn-helix domain-containing protein n=1 Tax=Pelosinus sp. sgz500959 TaxID=3242472 RepID=UPI00366AF031
MDEREGKPCCTVQELLAIEPLNKSVIAAGWLGKQRKISKVVEMRATSNIAGLEDTLVIVYPDEKVSACESVIELCLRSSAAAILIVNPKQILSQRLLDAAETYQIPLLFHYQPIDETDVVFSLELVVKLKDKDKLIDFAENSGLHQVTTILQTDLPTFLKGLSTYLQTTVALVNSVFQIADYCIKGEKIKEDELSKITKRICRQYHQHELNPNLQNRYRGDVCTEVGELIHYYINKLQIGDRMFGFLLVFKTGDHLNGLDLCRMRQTGLLCTKELMNQNNIKKIEMKYKDQFIYDLLYNNFENEKVLVQRGQYWGWNLRVPQQLFIIEPDDYKRQINKEQLLEELILVAQSFLKGKFQQFIIAEQQEQVLVIVPVIAEDAKTCRKNIKNITTLLQENIREALPDLGVSIGIGKFYSTGADLCRSYQEAKQALELGRFIRDKGHITHFEDLGIIRLLAHISMEQLDDFYKEYLQAVIDYDGKNNTNFLEILQTYFGMNGDFNLTAEKLFMHPNTLRNRLKKIEEILDTDFQQMENLLTLSVACKISKICKTGL